MTPLNPFAALKLDIAKKVLDDLRLKAHAQQRLQRLLATYEEMVQDPRYAAIRRELTLSLGDYLRELVDHAAHCARCVKYAQPVLMMQKVVAEPLEEVWFAREQEAAAEAPSPEEMDESDAS